MLCLLVSFGWNAAQNLSAHENECLSIHSHTTVQQPWRCHLWNKALTGQKLRKEWAVTQLRGPTDVPVGLLNHLLTQWAQYVPLLKKSLVYWSQSSMGSCLTDLYPFQDKKKKKPIKHLLQPVVSSQISICSLFTTGSVNISFSP